MAPPRSRAKPSRASGDDASPREDDLDQEDDLDPALDDDLAQDDEDADFEQSDAATDDAAAPRLPRAERPSKTQRKKQSHDLQALGEALVELPASRAEKLDLPESLVIALKDYRQTRSHEGRRRQMQYIGKLMRRVDPEPIRQAVAEAQIGSARETLALHQLESTRTLLIESDEAFTTWLDTHPGADVQQMRSLIRAARKDAASNNPEQRHGRAYRELFQLLKSATEAADDDA